MVRLAGVVAALLCVLFALPAAATNVVPPGWVERSGSGSGTGLSNSGDGIEGAQNSSLRNVSVAMQPDGKPVVAYIDVVSSQYQVIVKRWSGTSWDQLGGPLNPQNGKQALEPRVSVSAAGEIFVGWRQSVGVIGIGLYILRWNGTNAWVALPNADADGLVPTGADAQFFRIKSFSLALTPSGTPLLAFQATPEGASFDNTVTDPQVVFDQIYAMNHNLSVTDSWTYYGSDIFGGGATNAATFFFDNNGTAAYAFHSAVSPSIASDSAGRPYVALIYTNDFSTGGTPADYQGNKNDIYVIRWDGAEWMATGPPIPSAPSGAGLGAPGGVSASQAFSINTFLHAPGLEIIEDFRPRVIWAEGNGSGDGFIGFTSVRVSQFDGTNWVSRDDGLPVGGTSGNACVAIGTFSDGTTLDVTQIATWQHTPSGGGQSAVWAMRFDPGTSSWVEIGNGSASGGGIGGTLSSGYAPWLAVGGPSEFPVVTWIEQGISFPPQIFLREFTGTGAPAPTITGFSPASGPVGTEVTINGDNLDSVDLVAFALDVETQPGDVISSGLKVTVPPHAKTGKITVAGPGGQAVSTGNFIVTPRIDAFSPTAAGVGDTITITGFNLRVGSTVDPIVMFGGVRASLTGGFLGDTTVKAIVPAGAMTGPISVKTVDGTGTSATNFTLLQLPQVTSIVPAFGPVGTLVHIRGKGLSFVSALGYSSFSGASINSSAYLEVDSTEVIFEIPLGAGSGRLTIYNLLGSTNTSRFNVTPGITDVSPDTVVAGSDTVVTVSGTNLYASPTASPPTVMVGTIPIPLTSGPLGATPSAATPLAVTATTSVRFRVPLGVPSGKVSITNTAGTATSIVLNVIQPPKIVTLTPAMGPVGTPVMITGTGLNGSTLVTFGGNVSVTPTQVTPTSLKVTVPEGAFTGPLSVTTPAATATSATVFKVTPKITGFSPASVVAGSGTPVTITGSNLQALTGTNTVKVGALTIPSAFVLANSSTSIQFTVPLGAVTGKIGVTTVDGTGVSATDLVVIQPPKPAAFTPASGPVGTLLTISGANFSGNVSVTFGGNVTVAAQLISAAMVRATVPDGALTGKLSVTNEAGSGTTATTFKVSPKITGFTPASVVAGGGTPVTISGNNLQALTGTNTVKVGAFVIPAAAVLANSSTSITFVAPLGAFTGKISVTTVDGSAVSATDLIVIQPPKPAAFTPASGPVGTLVTINGANFSGNVSVTLGGNVTVAAQLISATMVKVAVPDGALTGKLSVTNEAGTGTTVGVFKVSPRITGFTPASVVAGRGTPVTIAGSNLQALTGTNTVKVGAFTIPSVAVLANSSTSLTFAVPLGAITGKIGVTTADGTGLSATNLVVIQPPKVTSLTPASGPVGALVTISGANFGGNVSVTFGGNVTAAATLISAVSVKASVPAGALTGPITVANEAGMSASVASFKVSPKITGFSPASAPVGSTDVIAVTGVNLFAATGAPVVRVGAVTVPAASVLGNSSATTIQFLLPSAATTGKISVTTIDGTGLSPTELIVIQPPRVSGFTPAAAQVGSEVTVNGSNFTGVTDVTFSAPPLDIISGSVGGPIPFLNRIGAQIVSATPTALKVTVPGGAIDGPIEVVNAAGSALSTQQFTVQPRITGFDPPTGNAGDSIVVMGYNLQSSGPNGPTPPTVKVNGVPAEVTAASATELTFTLPGLARTGPITVTTGDGTATSPGSLVVTTPVVPDLKVSLVSGPAAAIRSTAAKPQTMSVATTVTNQGLGAAGPFGVAIQLLASDGVTLRTIGTRTVTALASGATAMATTVVTLPADLDPGLYELHTVADLAGAVTELREDNNEAIAVQPVRIVDAVAGAYGFSFFLDSSPCLSVPGGGVILATGSGTMTQTLDRFSVASLVLTSGQLNLTLTSFTATLDEAGQVLPGTFSFRTVIQGTTVTGTGQFSGFEIDRAFDISFTAQTTSPAGCSFMGTAHLAPH